MKRTIVLKTDASVSSSRESVALGYEAVVYDEQGRYQRYSDSRYIPQYFKSTDAETVAAAFGVKEIYRAMEEEREDYELIIETDCESTVYDIEESMEHHGDVQRVLKFFADGFKRTDVRWVPRQKNERVDAIAKSALQRGWDNES